MSRFGQITVAILLTSACAFTAATLLFVIGMALGASITAVNLLSFAGVPAFAGAVAGFILYAHLDLSDTAPRPRKCAACGYSLRGLPTGARCPECGRVNSTA